MYTPSFNQFSDKQEVLSFMRKYSFGAIVTAVNNLPEATHLPFIIEERDDQIIITSHFARANPQSLQLENNQVMVIFTEPHAYISPKNYEHDKNVPTWNYIAVHAYGKARLFKTEQEHVDLLEKTINYYDSDYQKQWDSLPHKFKSGMIKGITGFEITVTDLQAKSKLSQNRSKYEQENIINSLSKSDMANDRDIAAYMASLNK